MKQNTIDAILIQWHGNKWQGIQQLSLSKLVCALWLVNLAVRTLLHGPLKLKDVFVANLSWFIAKFSQLKSWDIKVRILFHFKAKLQNTPQLICIWLNSSYFCFPRSKRWEDMQISCRIFWSCSYSKLCTKACLRLTVRLLKPGPPRLWKPIRWQNQNNRFKHFQIQPIKRPVENNEISTCS